MQDLTKIPPKDLAPDFSDVASASEGAPPSASNDDQAAGLLRLHFQSFKCRRRHRLLHWPCMHAGVGLPNQRQLAYTEDASCSVPFCDCRDDRAACRPRSGRHNAELQRRRRRRRPESHPGMFLFIFAVFSLVLFQERKRCCQTTCLICSRVALLF
jgi:hypothetical protein